MDSFQTANIIREAFSSARDFVVYTDWQRVISVLKIISGAISVLLFVGIIQLIIKLNLINKVKETGRLLTVPAHFSKKLGKKWTKIENRAKSGQEAELKLAVIEADKFFDDILKKCGYVGKDMGERLKKINSSQIANIDNIWGAHKVRNNVVHDVDYKLAVADAEKSIRAYKQALEELEVL